MTFREHLNEGKKNLSRSDKKAILKDFKEWSGGEVPQDHPWEDEDGEFLGLNTYLSDALSTKYDKKAVEQWFIELGAYLGF